MLFKLIEIQKIFIFMFLFIVWNAKSLKFVQNYRELYEIMENQVR